MVEMFFKISSSKMLVIFVVVEIVVVLMCSFVVGSNPANYHNAKYIYI